MVAIHGFARRVDFASRLNAECDGFGGVSQLCQVPAKALRPTCMLAGDRREFSSARSCELLAGDEGCCWRLVFRFAFGARSIGAGQEQPTELK